MCNRDWAVVTALVLASAMANAQPAKPDGAASSAAAMERARRQAAGPMRIILEAGKGRRKGAEAEAPAPAPADSNAVRPVASRGVAAPAAAAAVQAATAATNARPQAPANNVANLAAATAATPPAVRPEAAAADGGIVTQITLTADRALTSTSAAAVPALPQSATTAVEAVAVPGAPALSLPALAEAPVRPKLTTMVEPEVPQRVLDGLNRNTAVLVDLTLRANGSVAAVTLVPPTPRQLQRYLVQALEQWRFDPLPAERVHRVELVFNADR